MKTAELHYSPNLYWLGTREAVAEGHQNLVVYNGIPFKAPIHFQA